MTDQLTDEYLEKRAMDLARASHPADRTRHGEQHSELSIARRSCFDATLSALKVHRDGLKVLEGLRHSAECVYGREIMAGCDIGVETDCCSCGRDKQIASLKELLGVAY